MQSVDFSTYPKRKPAPRHAHTMLRFGVVADSLPPAPPNSNWYAGVESVGAWQMLGNDTYSDCAEAAMLHGLMARTAYADAPIVPTTDDALGLYGRVTGFDPTKPATDQGTMVVDLMAYCQAHSMVSERTDKVLLSVELDVTNFEELRQAIDLCGGILLGVRFPEAWSHSRVWGVTSSPLEGRHAIWAAGYSTLASGAVVFDVVTWGERLELTADGAAEFLDEAWALADLDFIAANGRDPQGILQTEYLKRVGELAHV